MRGNTVFYGGQIINSHDRQLPKGKMYLDRDNLSRGCKILN
jgi:hypothetical protein